MSEKQQFDPTPYLKDLANGKGAPRMYLPAAARVMWFRTEYPIESGWQLTTEPLLYEPVFIVKALVMNPEGVTIATAHAMCAPVPGKTYSSRELEKAETSAISRALAHAGYGTLFALEPDDAGDEAGFIADAPQPAKPKNPASKHLPATDAPSDGSDPRYNTWRNDVRILVSKTGHAHWKAGALAINGATDLLVREGILKAGMPPVDAAAVLAKYAEIRSEGIDREHVIDMLKQEAGS